MLGHFVQANFNVIGIIGVVFVLLAYLLLQLDRLKQDSITYSVMNLVGAIFILVSLCYTWNLASGVIEIAWLVISLFGVCKAVYLRRKAKPPNNSSKK